MANPAITPELIAKHGLSPEEYEKVLSILGREPSFEELGVFSVMWSEHCSYTQQNQIDIKGKTTGGRYYFIDTLENKQPEYLIHENKQFKIGTI